MRNTRVDINQSCITLGHFMKAENAHPPIYLQTAEMLIREISSGRLLDGEKLPTEREMASDLGIAVGTLRKALEELVSKGLVKRVHGSGNYIQHTPDIAGVYAFFRLELLKGGGLPTARVLSAARKEKGNDLPDFGVSKDGHCIRRVRSLSGVPAAMEEIWLDGKWADQMNAEELPDALYHYYQKSLGLLIGRIEDTVSVAAFPDWTLQDIGRKTGEISGFVERKSMTANGEVVEFSRTWFNPDRVRYVVRFK